MLTHRVRLRMTHALLKVLICFDFSVSQGLASTSGLLGNPGHVLINDDLYNCGFSTLNFKRFQLNFDFVF